MCRNASDRSVLIGRVRDRMASYTLMRQADALLKGGDISGQKEKESA
jgi:hypothetical protein|nr:MAG TPA: hypothetical protein [Caudoviricetes sp.]